MNRFKLITKHCSLAINLPKFAIILSILLAFNLSMPLQVDAQRHGGGVGGRSFGGGAFSHSGSSFGRMNTGSFGHEGFAYRGFHGYRGFSGYRGTPG